MIPSPPPCAIAHIGHVLRIAALRELAHLVAQGARHAQADQVRHEIAELAGDAPLGNPAHLMRGQHRHGDGFVLPHEL